MIYQLAFSLTYFYLKTISFMFSQIMQFISKIFEFILDILMLQSNRIFDCNVI